jgi:hypothetical protein
VSALVPVVLQTRFCRYPVYAEGGSTLFHEERRVIRDNIGAFQVSALSPYARQRRAP